MTRILGAAFGLLLATIISAGMASAHPVHTEPTPDTYWARAYYPPDGPSEAENLGPQFTYAFDEHDYGIIAAALHEMEGRPEYDDYYMLRQKRVLAKVTYRRVMWIGPNGEEWLPPVQLTLPETILTGIALSRYWVKSDRVREWLVDEPVVVAGGPNAVVDALGEMQARKTANDNTAIAWTDFMNRLVEPKAQALRVRIASMAQPSPYAGMPDPEQCLTAEDTLATIDRTFPEGSASRAHFTEALTSGKLVPQRDATCDLHDGP